MEISDSDALNSAYAIKKYCSKKEYCDDCGLWDKELLSCMAHGKLSPRHWYIKPHCKWCETEYLIAKALYRVYNNYILHRIDGGVRVSSGTGNFTIPNSFFPSMQVGEKVFVSRIVREWEESNHDD